MTTVTWTIEQMERQAETSGVVAVYWRAIAADGGRVAETYGSISFTPDHEAPDFVPFDALTEADVLAWVFASLDKMDTEARLAGQIDAGKSPAAVVGGLPW